MNITVSYGVLDLRGILGTDAVIVHCDKTLSSGTVVVRENGNNGDACLISLIDQLIRLFGAVTLNDDAVNL